MKYEKYKYLLFIFIIQLSCNCVFAFRNESKERWKLVWQDNFNTNRLDTATWSYMDRRNDGCRLYHSKDKSCYGFKRGKLILRGIKNSDLLRDTARYLTGGIMTRNKVAFGLGKIEIKAKLKCANGAWPAIWMLPFKLIKGWPADGEIDIMEHSNYDNFIYQTVHTSYTKNNPNAYPKRSITVPVDVHKFNVYGVEVSSDEVIFYVNGNPTLRYPKIDKLGYEDQFPFNHEWYLMLCMQLGGASSSQVDASQLPVEMEIDWVRYYQKD